MASRWQRLQRVEVRRRHSLLACAVDCYRQLVVMSCQTRTATATTTTTMAAAAAYMIMLVLAILCGRAVEGLCERTE